MADGGVRGKLRPKPRSVLGIRGGGGNFGIATSLE